MLGPKAGSSLPPPLGSYCLKAGRGLAGLDHAGLDHAGRGLAGHGHTGFGHTGRNHSESDCLETQLLKYELVVVVVYFGIEMLNHNVVWVWQLIFVGL